jgi:hypothetical protein
LTVHERGIRKDWPVVRSHPYFQTEAFEKHAFVNMAITPSVYTKITQNPVAIEEHYLLGCDIDCVVW